MPTSSSLFAMTPAPARLEPDCIPAGMELFPAANEDQFVSLLPSSVINLSMARMPSFHAQKSSSRSPSVKREDSIFIACRYAHWEPNPNFLMMQSLGPALICILSCTISYTFLLDLYTVGRTTCSASPSAFLVTDSLKRCHNVIRQAETARQMTHMQRQNDKITFKKI